MNNERVPLNWAMTQNNPAVNSKALVSGHSGSETLQQAAEACREALKELDRERSPYYWAMAQGSPERVRALIFERKKQAGPSF